ncbi:hypothetical protein HKX42_08895 [Salinisphaera sp. USBA-960]|nr:hypothetical protein [Salifodinibacter halophilus]NNC26990.1 hypothetical protein [Salifodinibacter halophilus]
MKLILHIGIGKTGTTAFQRFCNLNEGILRENGYIYAGTLLQNITLRPPFEHIGQVGNPAILARGLSKLDSIAQHFSKDTKALIWSNESLSMSRSPEELAACFDDYIKNSKVFSEWEVYVVLRRQDQWIESAYKQWALKHKTYKGTGIMDPGKYAESVAYLLDYYSWIQKWNNTSASVFACSYDAVLESGGIAPYFIHKMDLNLPEKESMDYSEHTHGSLSNDMSMLVALYNQHYEEPNNPTDLLTVLNDTGLAHLSDSKESCFFSREMKQEIFDRFKDTNDKVNSELFSDRESFNDKPIEDKELYEPDYLRLISHLLIILSKRW